MARLQRNIPSLNVIKTVRLLGNSILYFTVMRHDAEHKKLREKTGVGLLANTRFLSI